MACWNLYNAGANSFDIQNATLNTTALSINSTNNYVTINGIVDTGTNEIAASVYTARGDGTNAGSIYLKQRTSINGASSTYSSISASGTTLIRFGLNDGTTNRVFNFSAAGLSTTSRTYLLPDADGTMALTSNLSAYLPLTGGTLTGALSGTSATFSSSVGIGISPVVPTGTGKVLQISNTTIVQSVAGSQTLFGDNVYYNGSNWQYLTSNFASAIRIGALASGNLVFIVLHLVLLVVLNNLGYYWYKNGN